MKARSILITGCSSGIGHAVAHGLATRGWRVFATARKAEDVARLNAEGLESLALDLDDPASIRAALDEVLRRTEGRLDALFNNGGFGQVGAVEDLTRDALREQFETNLFGWIELTNRVIPVMRRQGCGRIVMNSSVLGYAAFAYRGAYNAVKFALEGISDTLRHELAGTGIHVCLVEPGPITSRFRENCLPHFLRHIDWQHSVHRAQYERQLARLKQPGPAAPFTLSPQAVLDKVIHAIESPRPRARYPVTVPAVAFWWLRRLLPIRAMDWVLMRASGGGKR
ncbi:short-subunit dehydrogenase [Sulfuritortus calidifontis]|uniref:Short-subunit dehydrogenase n=1 Tax=Sulfuritortus calidifontis TaxID=1914471 RepID=A0A4R3JPE7_9PROT|nr:SDR family oxidoreductase [Sulfuritortus calidifontis]TCS68550.1 short-subunit dehydrogenase [Sulfuritortus calidifontis]